MPADVEPGRARSGELPLGPEQVEQWRTQGVALVDAVLPPTLVEAARDDAASRFPAPGTAEAEAINDFGSGGRMQFPSESTALNEITLHPRLLAAVSQLLGVQVSDLRLTQSDLWAKYGRHTRTGGALDNADQRMHVDYPNHTLTHPPPWNTPEAVELILYLSDVDECGGATAFVPRTGSDDPAYAYPIVNTPGVAGHPWINDRGTAEDTLSRRAPAVAKWRAEHLYSREVRTRYRCGTLLLYRHDTWHRGTPLEPGTRRLAQNLTFRRAASEWISVLHTGWSWAMYRPSGVMERLIAEASVEQRCVLGFPAPGHPYWTEETLAAVGARYGAYGMDLSPYARC